MAEVKNSNKPITLDLSETSRSKIWVNGDCTKVIELNLTDFNVMTRAKDALSKLDELQSEANKLASDEVLSSEEDSEAKFDELIEAFRSIDKKMREIVDYIFDFPVCDVCCDGGSMYDPIKGQYRYEYIIEKLMKLYDENWTKETKLAQDRIKSHTAKYTKKRSRK